MNEPDQGVRGKGPRRKKIIIFSDLDGTLLSHPGYSFEEAGPALRLLSENEIPLVICSSKTRGEIEHYRERLANSHPFIAENGGGILIPSGYFHFELDPQLPAKDEGRYQLIRLGARYGILREALESLRREGFAVKGFGDMTVEEVAQATGLSTGEARLARVREFDEPFFFEGSEEERQKLLNRIREKGFNTTEGLLLHITGDNDKGKAVLMLIEFYKREYGAVTTVALGDSPNDVPMLDQVDYPVIVRKSDGTYDARIDLPDLIRADGIGPEGWKKAVLELIIRLDEF